MNAVKVVLWLTGIAPTFVGWLIFAGVRWLEGRTVMGPVLMLIGFAIVCAAIVSRGHLSRSMMLGSGSMAVLSTLILFGTDRFVNAGSGQDAVALAAFLAAAIGGLAAIVLLVAGLLAR